jgi:hypothetical protein
MMKKLKKIVTLFAVCLIIIASFAQNALAQMRPERVKVAADDTTIDKILIDSTLINRNNVAICNDTGQDIKILIGENFPLDTFLIKDYSIWYSKSYTKDQIFISIRTGDYIIKYVLFPEKAYILCWNEKYWDLQKLYRD